MRFLHTVVGVVAMTGLVMLIDCLPEAKQRLVRSVANADGAPGSCDAKTAPLLLCGRVTLDGKHECAICREQSCNTVTGVYCAKSCDDATCRPR